MTKGKGIKITPQGWAAIIVALITVMGGILTAILSNPRFFASATNTPAPTATFTPSPTSTQTPTATSTLTPTVTASPTPVLTPLQGVFLGVGNGVFFLFPDDKPETIAANFLESGECVYSPPYGLQLIYGSTGGKGWGVHWDNPPAFHFDASQKQALRFMVKGALGGETFQIGVKDTSGKEIKLPSEVYVLVSAAEWREVNVPLEHFAAKDIALNLSFLNNISVSFEARHKSGSLCLDDFAFIDK